MKRIMTSLVLIFLIFSSTTAVYSQFQKDDDLFLDSISDFYLVDQDLKSHDGSTLVPVGAIRGINDVYYIEYQYEVIVKQGMDLEVLIDDLLFTNATVSREELKQTFHFDIEEQVLEQLDYSEHFLGQKVNANRVAVSVKVSMCDPATYDLFLELAGGSLTFEVYFYAV